MALGSCAEAGPSTGRGWAEQGVSCRLWVNWTQAAKPPEAGGGRKARSRSRIQDFPGRTGIRIGSTPNLVREELANLD